MNRSDTMTIEQALTLATLVLEWECENCPQDSVWQWEVKTARQVIAEAMRRPPAGDFFLSAPTRRRAGRPSNY